LHKGFSPLWNDQTPDAYKTIARDTLAKKFSFLNNHLEGRNYVMGSQFTVPDAYIFTVLNWTKFLKIEMDKWPAVLGFMERVKMRPSTQAAIAGENLKK
jgi:glutathione S-transferase